MYPTKDYFFAQRDDLFAQRGDLFAQAQFSENAGLSAYRAKKGKNSKTDGESHDISLTDITNLKPDL